jgi:hypothetical protein
MKNKQTAVEWLVEQIQSGKIEVIYSDKIHSIKCIPEIVDQAKAMEKEQIIQTYHKAALNEATHIIAGTSHISAEQYYNETYGK